MTGEATTGTSPEVERFERVALERRGPVAIVTLDCPERRNALGPPVRGGLRAALAAVTARADVRAIVLTGAGPVFCAGADFREDLARMAGADNATALMGEFVEFFLWVEAVPQPIVAAVNGPALAGGMELLLACDLIVAAAGARFGLPEARVLGVPPAFGLSRLPQRVGLGAARRMILAGSLISADEALRVGLVEQVVPADQLLPTAIALAEELAQAAPLAVRLAKRTLNAPPGGATPDPLQMLPAAAALFATDDVREALAAFNARRAPVFQGK